MSDLSRSLRIATISGVDVRIHTSWILIALLVTWSFWGRFNGVYGHGAALAIALAVITALGFFASILIHELAHALEAQHRGVEVSGITLFIFGGATETSFDVKRPLDEFALSAIGPFSSLVLGCAAGIVATIARPAGYPAVAQVAGVMGWINVSLALFNLLPGAPLDGGRILRSITWAITKDRGRAVRVAVRTGQGLGILIAGLGLYQLFFLQGGLVGGIWFAFIGWFLFRAASGELEQHLITEQLTGRSAAELAGPLPDALDADRPLADLETHLAGGLTRDAYPVTRDGELVGVLDVDRIATVPRDERGTRTIGDLAEPLDDLPTVQVDTDAKQLLDVIRREDLVAVCEDGELVGLLAIDELEHVIRRLHQLDGRRQRRRRR